MVPPFSNLLVDEYFPSVPPKNHVIPQHLSPHPQPPLPTAGDKQSRVLKLNMLLSRFSIVTLECEVIFEEHGQIKLISGIYCKGSYVLTIHFYRFLLLK